jgi:hypothetical protein
VGFFSKKPFILFSVNVTVPIDQSFEASSLQFFHLNSNSNVNQSFLEINIEISISVEDKNTLSVWHIEIAFFMSHQFPSGVSSMKY